MTNCAWCGKLLIGFKPPPVPSGRWTEEDWCKWSQHLDNEEEE